ncbi:hypothetical protein DEU56DRAFT_727980, partial [Suillus clintonianus]|uniref:uncharacterized protein n=1 Tax=Suillus clintonianus TaxID=1904413 RepID=UPI001B878C47
LKYWLNRPSCPPVFREVKSLFDRLVSPSIDANPISFGGQSCMLAHFTVYTRDSTHVGNSLVLYYPGGIKNVQPTPGIIKYIFETKGVVGFAVQRHLPQYSRPDPFRHYPHFPARLYSSALADHLETVMPDWVVSHFARWNFSTQHIVAVSLCQVRSSRCFHML